LERPEAEGGRVVKRIHVQWTVLFATSLLAASPAASSSGPSGAVIRPSGDLAWSPAGVPGVSTAVVQGDLSNGPSRFYLKYAAGFVAPVHHHSPDHFVTTVSGQLVLVIDGTEHRLAPGSYFALTGKAKHGARCEGGEDCVMFIDALGPWDVVAEPAAQQ
jgi:mannose-6-phosphate isomerase-like protein (cupin superfamily)